jgi:hypothetical protein
MMSKAGSLKITRVGLGFGQIAASALAKFMGIMTAIAAHIIASHRITFELADRSQNSI